VGGVKSSTFKKEASWITYSFDVKLEGKGACRLTDKMFHNHQNTVNMGGLLQAPLEAWPELIELCLIVCQCDKEPTSSASGASELKQQCVENTLTAQDAVQRGLGGPPSNMRPEVPYNMTATPSPTPLLHRVPGGTSLEPTTRLPTRMAQEGLRAAKNNFGVYDVRIPDVVISRSIDASPAGAMRSLTAPNLKAVAEIKFNAQPRDPDQIADYERIAGDPNRVVELDPKECRCNEPDPKTALEREHAQARQRAAAAQRAASPRLAPQPAPASSGIFDLKTWEAVTGLTGTALILYLIVSEGSRLFPPRNLVPVP
jgi:hypothetical protein